MFIFFYNRDFMTVNYSQTAVSLTEVLVRMSVIPGQLEVISPQTATLSSVVSSSEAIITKGQISNIRVIDGRGTLTGWSLFLSAKNLGLKGESARIQKKSSGIDSTSQSSDFFVNGVYDGKNFQSSYTETGSIPSGEFIMKVDEVSGNPQKPSSVIITKPDQSVLLLPVINNMVSFNGLTVNFQLTSGKFQPQDEFGILVDHFSYIQLKAIPEQVLALPDSPADLDGIRVSPAAAFTGSDAFSNNQIQLVAEQLRGTGAYIFQNRLEWTLHKNPMPGIYQSTFIYTIL